MESWHGWLQRVNFRNYIFLSHNFFLQSNFSFISILFTAQTRTVGINVKNSILLRIVLFSICILSLIKKLNTRLCFSLSSVLQMSFSIISYNSFLLESFLHLFSPTVCQTIFILWANRGNISTTDLLLFSFEWIYTQ